MRKTSLLSFVFAVCAALPAQTTWIVDAGPVWGLIAMAPLVPVLNRLYPAPAHRWRAPASHPKGDPTCVPS